eukprot:scaffold185802_cov10-Tisochrysis_lutea.AAC.1
MPLLLLALRCAFYGLPMIKRPKFSALTETHKQPGNQPFLILLALPGVLILQQAFMCSSRGLAAVAS